MIPVARERLWDFLMDVPAVGRCVPGVERIEAVDANAYRGGLRMCRSAPSASRSKARSPWRSRTASAWRARMRAEANDRRLGGGIRARLSLTLVPAEVGTRVRIDTDLAVLGKIGEFGQPVIRRKADTLLEEFARNLRSALAA